MAGWANAATPNPAAVRTFANTPVTIAHSPAAGCPRLASTAPSATMPRAPMAAPRMLAARWLAKNWGVVTYLDQPARSVFQFGWWVSVPANSSAAHTGSAHRPSRAARASGPAPGLMDCCVLMVASLPALCLMARFVIFAARYRAGADRLASMAPVRAAGVSSNPDAATYLQRPRSALRALAPRDGGCDHGRVKAGAGRDEAEVDKFAA